jgi:hypothetical protein
MNEQKFRTRLNISIVILVVAFAALFFTSRTKNSRVRPGANSSSEIKTDSSSNPKTSSGSVLKTPPQTSLSFEKRFENEARAIGAIDEFPEETEKRLREWASVIPVVEFEGLQSRALDQRLNGDDRFLAAQLLGWSENRAAIAHLENIALAPIPPLTDERALSFETGIRGLAVEGIGELGSVDERLNALTRVSQKTDRSFLSDRAQRTIAWVKDPQLESPADQDRRALGQLAGK